MPQMISGSQFPHEVVASLPPVARHIPHLRSRCLASSRKTFPNLVRPLETGIALLLGSRRVRTFSTGDPEVKPSYASEGCHRAEKVFECIRAPSVQDSGYEGRNKKKLSLVFDTFGIGSSLNQHPEVYTSLLIISRLQAALSHACTVSLTISETAFVKLSKRGKR